MHILPRQMYWLLWLLISVGCWRLWCGGAAAVMQQQMHRQKGKGSGIAPVQQETTRPMQDHRAKVCSRRGGSPEQQRREAAAVGK